MNLVATYRLRAEPGGTGPVEGWLREFAERAGWPQAVVSSLDLVLEEWLSNVIKYAYDDPPGERWIELRFVGAPGWARVEIEDDGREFDLLKAPQVDVTQPLESRAIGGLGVHLIRESMDSVEYRRSGGRNVVTLGKRLPS